MQEKQKMSTRNRARYISPPPPHARYARRAHTPVRRRLATGENAGYWRQDGRRGRVDGEHKARRLSAGTHCANYTLLVQPSQPSTVHIRYSHRTTKAGAVRESRWETGNIFLSLLERKIIKVRPQPKCSHGSAVEVPS